MHSFICLVGLGALALVGLAWPLAGQLRAEDPWIVCEGKDGPGKGKPNVLIAGNPARPVSQLTIENTAAEQQAKQ